MVYSYNLQLFAKDGEGGEKTEPATPKKLDKAREEGQAPKSQDLNTAVLLLVLFGCLKVFGSFMMKRLYDMFQFYYGNINDYATDVSVQADTIEEQRHRELQIPEFLKPQQKGIMERSMAARRV